MKVYMEPRNASETDANPSGIQTVVIKYEKYLPRFGVQFVGSQDDADVVISHAGILPPPKTRVPLVAVCHGLYWTADYNADKWEYGANWNVIENLRFANEITVPSRWVAKTIERDMHVSPNIVGHGVEVDEWYDHADDGYILAYGKNRAGDVCDPSFIPSLALRFQKQKFIATIGPRIHPDNVEYIGVTPHHQFKSTILNASVVLSTTKETFGIMTLEAMASGKPILGYAHGGNLDIVKHGVNGYLAEPGNIDDLAKGLDYCLRNKTVLGKNSLELSKQWTWEIACEKLYNVLLTAIRGFKQDESVSVIIPSYNYARLLPRVVGSCLDQTHKPSEIIIVDDGSTDNTREVASELSSKNSVVKYIYQPNSGVANARNNGVENSTGDFIMCIDADDMIEPQFIEACYQALHNDRRIGIAYTGLRWVKPDGTSGMSQWPGEFNYDDQLQRKNQIPTCALMRREIWERLGGQRQRYAPLGAGSEDANFWLRAGSIGYDAKKVTDAGLFIYSWGSGYVSGNKEYSEVDWMGMHPWTRDGNHPFASLAKADFYSHKVHQYDSPIVSVIIPVGKGHEKDIINALDSLESQTFRDWEAIVVWDSPNEIPKVVKSAFPFARFYHTPSPMSGPGVGRNIGVKQSTAKFVLFLDADDSLFPEALDAMLDVYKDGNSAIIYSDYVSKSYWDEDRLGELGGRILDYNKKTKEVVYSNYAFDYDCSKAQIQPQPTPYHWCLVTCLIPRPWHNEIGGFDESMKSFEDVDYHWRMAFAGKCYQRISEPLVVYRFDRGTRRVSASFETNREVGEKLLVYMQEKYRSIKKMPCPGGCGKSTAMPKSDQTYNTRVMQSTPVSGREMNDSDYVEVTYVSDNRGDAPIYGTATRKFYGYRVPGEKFLMHKADVEQLPDKYVINAKQIIGVEEAKEELQSPTLISQTAQSMPVQSMFDLRTVPGVTSSIESQLKQNGYTTLEKLKTITEEELLSYDGIGKVRAGAILEWLKHQ